MPSDLEPISDGSEHLESTPAVDTQLTAGDPDVGDGSNDPVSSALNAEAQVGTQADDMNAVDPAISVDPAQQTQAAVDIRDYARHYGLHNIANAPDPAAAQQELLQNYLYSLQYAQAGQEYAANRAEFEQYRATRQQFMQGGPALYGQNPYQPQPQAPPAPQSAIGRPTDWKDDYRQFLVTDEDTGRTDWRAGTPADVVQAGTKFAKWGQEFHSQFQSDPEAALAPVMEARDARILEQARNLVRQELGQQFTQRETHYDLSNKVRENASWIFQADPATGQPLRDPRTGAEVYSPAGYRFHQRIDELRASGVNDPRTLWNLATQLLVSDLHAQSAANQPPAPQQPQPMAQAPVAPQANQNARNLQGVAQRLRSQGQTVVSARKPGGPVQAPMQPLGGLLRQELMMAGLNDNNLHSEEF